MLKDLEKVRKLSGNIQINTPFKSNADRPIITVNKRISALKINWRSNLRFFSRQIMSRNKLIISAGGILYRKTNGQVEIALVKSAKDRNWCLPKGKADIQDESLLQTALRETQEETGCTAEPLEYAGDFSYRIDGATKMVFIWHMNLITENVRPIESDILALRWLSPIDAIALLDRKRERRFLSRTLLKENLSTGNSVKLRLIRPTHLKNKSQSLPPAVEFDSLALKK